MLIKPFAVKNFISEDLCKVMATEFAIMRDTMKVLDGPGFDNIENSFSWYSPICFETLSTIIKPKVEQLVNKKLHPSYSYGRIYNKGSILTRHLDRKSSELTVSICLKKDIPWPLNWEWEEKTLSLDSEPRGAVIGCGSATPHWRTLYEGTEHIQAFMQYVIVGGEYDYLKYDTRPCIGSPYELVDNIVRNEDK
jgi:hypothetical protein